MRRFVPDTAADFQIYDCGDLNGDGSEYEWFVDHLVRGLNGGGFRGRIQAEEGEEYSKPLPRNAVGREIAAQLRKGGFLASGLGR